MNEYHNESNEFKIGKEKDSVNPFDEENDLDMENKNEDSEVPSDKSVVKNKIETNKDENLENKVIQSCFLENSEIPQYVYKKKYIYLFVSN